MVVTLGMDCQFGAIEAMMTGLEDLHPKARKYHLHILGFLCGIMFLASLSLTTTGGAYVLTLFDDYSQHWNIMFIAFFECVSVAYVYGEEQNYDC